METNVTMTLVAQVEIEGLNGYTFSQKIVYENWSKYCQRCSQVGHKCEDKANKKVVQMWVPKRVKTPHVVTLESAITLEAVGGLTLTGVHGWQAATKVARRT